MNFNVYTATTEEFELEFMRLMTKTVKELNQICKDIGKKMYHHHKKFDKCYFILFPIRTRNDFRFQDDVDWVGVYDRFDATFFYKKHWEEKKKEEEAITILWNKEKEEREARAEII